MRSIRKIAALVLSLAMLATMFAFSASAETAANLYLEGPANATQGEVYTVSIRLSDADNLVGGFSGTLTYSGATFVKTEVHPSVLALNDTTDASTVITNEGTDTIQFVTVTRVDGTNTINPTNAIWFKVQFEITGEAASFTLNNVKFSNKAGQALLTETEGTVGAALAPTVAVKDYAINTIEMKDTDDAKTQGLKYGVSFPNGIPADATEYGVIFLPTSLLEEGKELTEANYDNEVVAKVTSDNANFDTIAADGTYYAYLNFNFNDEAKAYQFLGTKISARAYYKVGDTITYSTNTNNIGVEDGVADKAVLNVAKEAAEKVEINVSTRVSDDQLAIALTKLDDATDYATYRGQLLQYVVDNF